MLRQILLINCCHILAPDSITSYSNPLHYNKEQYDTKSLSPGFMTQWRLLDPLNPIKTVSLTKHTPYYALRRRAAGCLLPGLLLPVPGRYEEHVPTMESPRKARGWRGLCAARLARVGSFSGGEGFVPSSSPLSLLTKPRQKRTHPAG